LIEAQRETPGDFHHPMKNTNPVLNPLRIITPADRFGPATVRMALEATVLLQGMGPTP
jgi:hypothetical protein